jgi:type IV pilus assembly protein PilC
MQFNYVARDKLGEVHTGTIKAPTQEEAVAVLQANDLIVISCQSTEGMPVWMRQVKFLQKVKNKDLVNFSRQLSILFSAKVSLVVALRALAKQQKSEYFQNIINDISNDVEAGTIFSKALAKYPKIFSAFFINLIKSGEVSGNLENSLNYLADHLEKQYYLQTRLRNALMYPGFIFLGFIVVAVLMLVLVIPNLVSILEQSGQELPFTTTLIIWLSDLLRDWGWLILVFLIFAGFLVWRYAHSPKGKRFFDQLKLKLPIFGEVFRKIYISRFSDNLSILIRGGLPILQALQISADVIGNVIFTELVLAAKEEVRIGNPMSSAFEKTKEIPPMVTQMIFTGERTGQLELVLQKVSAFYGREVDNVISTLSTLIEPILIVFLGIGVAILLGAILMPIYNIASGM